MGETELLWIIRTYMCMSVTQRVKWEGSDAGGAPAGVRSFCCGHPELSGYGGGYVILNLQSRGKK